MIKRLVKRSLAVVLSAMIALCMLITGAPMVSAEAPTNVGLAAWALRAYREGWAYVWGGTSVGAVDCSGLIASYHGVGGIRFDMLASTPEWGYVSNGIPNIHGLGLQQPGHIGVYIGSGMAVDARDEWSGVVYHNVYNKSWSKWFKVADVSYPEYGWVLLDGESFFYENGQYITNTSRTLDGVTYYFDAAGVSNIAPPSSAYQATDYSTSTTPVYQDNNDDQSKVDEQKQQQEEEARRQAEEQKRQEEEARKQAEEQERARKEAEEKKKQEEEKKKQAEEQKRREAEAKKLAEEKRKQEEEAAVIAEYGHEDTDDSKTVTSIQTRLYELGYLKQKATGYYGGDTSDAVMLFQSQNDLEVNGSVNKKTLQVLKSNKAVSNFNLLEQGAFDDGSSLAITALQERLAELKYYYDDITGYYGELTSSAVKQFQKNNDLEVTGNADPETQVKLFGSNAVVNPNAGSVCYGESGAMVVNLQKRLIELRYFSGVVTEKFDDATLEAVHNYQKAAGLEEADKLTPEQLEVLYSDDAVKSADYDVLRYGYAGEDVAQLQSRLASLNYYDGKTSGVYSKAVVSAVEDFQKDYNLEVTGTVDDATQEAIKVEAQKESNNANEQLILKTATISDNALAGVADTNTAEAVLAQKDNHEFVKTLIIMGAVVAVAFLFLTVFMIENKRKKNAKRAAARRVIK